jgi:hypothetical protein
MKFWKKIVKSIQETKNSGIEKLGNKKYSEIVNEMSKKVKEGGRKLGKKVGELKEN